MKRMLQLSLLICLVLMLVSLAPGVAVGATGDPVLINEVLSKHVDTDDTEFIELFGTPGHPLDGLSLIAIESVSSLAGTIDLQVDFGPGDQLGTNGFYLVGVPSGLQDNYGVMPNLAISSNSLENDALTLALVETATLGTQAGGSEVVLDAVAIVEDDADDVIFYGAPQVGPEELSGGILVTPAGARRVSDGVDTDTAADWVFADFDLGPANTPTPSDSAPPPPPPDLVTIQEIQETTDPDGDSPLEGETVVVRGVVTAFYFSGGDRYAFIQDGTGPWSGMLIFEPNIDAFINEGDLLEVEGEVSEFFGMTEIAFGDAKILSSGNELPAAEILPTGDVSQEQWEGVLVRVNDVTVDDDDLGFGEWSVDDGSGSARVDDLGNYDYEPSDGDHLRWVQGALNYSFGNFKIEPRGDDDILAILTIMEIQGDEQFSPYEGVLAETTGVVTLIGGGDMWIQDAAGDGDPATSDGILVEDYFRLSPAPQIGDMVRLIGDVEEQQFGPALPRTRIDDPDDWPFEIVASEQALPDPVRLVDLPNEAIPDAIDFWEPLEGMLVDIENGFVVAPTSRFGEFAMLTEADADADLDSGYYAQEKQLLISSIGPNQVDYNAERILVDDSSLSDAIQVIPGDRIRYLMGVVDFTFGNYKLQPGPAEFEVKNHNLPKMPVSTRSGPNGDTVITTFNVENLFDLEDTPGKDDIGTGGAETEEALEKQLQKLALAIYVELELPEIVVVQEVENESILQRLGDDVNMMADTDYQATSFETSDGRGIEAGFLWDADRVSLEDAFQMSGPDVDAWFGPGSPSPGREPIVGVFDIEGQTVTIVGNHFKSKGGDDALFNVNWPAPPFRVTEIQRKGQAGAVRNFVNGILDEDPDALVMVTGDLNDFQFGEPGEGDDHPVAILEGGPGEVKLTNLLNHEKPSETYTFIFDGNSQVLDHMLVSPALYKMMVATDILHFNAGYPAALDEDGNTTLRAADHDPLEGRFNFAGAPGKGHK